MKKSIARYRLSIYKQRCKINKLVRERTGNSIFFIFYIAPSVLTSIFFLDQLYSIVYLAFASSRSFLLLFSALISAY